MNKNIILYQEIVEMPNQEIGMNVFRYNCHNCPSTGLFPLHWHKQLEIICVIDGWLEVEIERETHLVRGGNAAIINPCQLHSCSKFDPHTTLYCMLIDMDILRSRLVESLDEKYITPLMEGTILLPSVTNNPKLFDFAEEAFFTFQAQQTAYILYLKSVLFGIMYTLFALCGPVRGIEQKKAPSTISRERVNLILEYVDTHFAERVKLDDLVDIVHINKYYICKIFQEHTGRTFLDYVNLVRIQKAVELLVSTNDSITAIAFATGFQDINYFSRIFKRVMGISPTVLRKKQRLASAEDCPADA